MSTLTRVLIIIGAWILVAILGANNVIQLPLPPEWLKAWTGLLISVTGATIGARVLWVAPALLKKYLDLKS